MQELSLEQRSRSTVAVRPEMRGTDLARAFVLALALGALPALGCDYPDEGNMPLRRALTRVQMLPETEAWHRERRDKGDVVQYRLSLDEEKVLNRRCYWTVEALADGKLWRRFYVTPDGKSVLTQAEAR